MPRLTSKQYVTSYKRLRRYWLNACGRDVFGYLEAHEQWYLHDYFQLSKDLAKAELLAHRQAVTTRRPSLPHQAGHALAKFERAILSWESYRTRARLGQLPNNKNGRRKFELEIRGVVRPQPDAEVMAGILIRLAKSRLSDSAMGIAPGDSRIDQSVADDGVLPPEVPADSSQ